VEGKRGENTEPDAEGGKFFMLRDVAATNVIVSSDIFCFFS